MFCPRCQTPCDANASYCSRCGQAIRTDAPQPHVVINMPDPNNDAINRYINQRPWIVGLILALIVTVVLGMYLYDSFSMQQQTEQMFKDQQHLQERLFNQ